MADAGERELARLGAGGDLDASARLLRVRLRSGRLSPERLRMAALLGDPASLLALGDDAPSPELELGKFLRRLDDQEAICRGVVVLGWSVLPVWEETFSRAAAPRQALEACDGWLESGGSAKAVVEAVLGAQRVRECAREAARLAADAVDPAVGVAGLVVSRDDDWSRCAEGLGLSGDDLLRAVVVACAGPQGEASLHGVIGSALQQPTVAVAYVVMACRAVEGLALTRDGSPEASGRCERLHKQVGVLVQSAGRHVGADALRRALADALIPWALAEPV